MGYVISASTSVSNMGAVQSVSVDLSPQIERLYQLGTSTPYNKNIITQHRLSVTIYAGSGPSYGTAASTQCQNANSLSVTVSPGTCGGSVGGISNTWYVTSYSYNKDAQGWGTESWSMVSAPESSDGGTATMIRGVAEGSATTGGASTGVLFIGEKVAGASIQVQAGSPGIGRADNAEFGEVSSVGGGTGQGIGLTGSASVSIPYTPIYL